MLLHIITKTMYLQIHNIHTSDVVIDAEEGVAQHDKGENTLRNVQQYNCPFHIVII